MPKVHYFELYGRAEMIRMALHYLGVEFENVFHAGEDWAAFKPETPFGQMPCLELDDGTMLGQSVACVEYVARKWGDNKEGFNPTDALQVYNGIANSNLINEDWLMKHLMKAWFMPDGEEKTKALENAIGVEYPKTMALLEKRVPAEGFLSGPNLSKYDIYFSGFWLNIVRSPAPKNQEMVD